MSNGKTITPEDLPDHITHPDSNRDLSIKKRTALFETGERASTISKYGNNLNGKTLAAKELKIGLRTLYRKMGIQN